ncbi:MAG: YgfZ/GcvT domain-containing protein, partial [Candidatus Promineifilaceae bacterium]
MTTPAPTLSPITPTATPQAYQAAHTDAILVDHSRLGVLRFSGRSRLELINRMSTQKVDTLEPGQSAATVLTSDIGRVIDRLRLYARPDDVLCLTGEDNAEAIARYLLRFVFFLDDFQVEELSDQTAIFGLYGPRAGERLAALVEKAEFSLTHFPADPLAGQGHFLLVPAGERDRLEAQLTAAGVTPAGDADYDYVRIESGWPRFGRELSLDYIPLEANLWADVSFTKGCYT